MVDRTAAAGTNRPRRSDATRVTFVYDSLGNRTIMADTTGTYTSTYKTTNDGNDGAGNDNDGASQLC